MLYSQRKIDQGMQENEKQIWGRDTVLKARDRSDRKLV